jgi:hypothetical protein
MIEVDECVGLPQLLAQFLAADDIPSSSEEEHEDVERTAAQFELPALLSQFACAAVDLEKTKPVRGPRRISVRHRLFVVDVDSNPDDTTGEPLYPQ